MLFEHHPMQEAVEPGEIPVRTLHRPGRHVLLRYENAVPLKVFFHPPVGKGVDILPVDDRGFQGRAHDTPAEEIRGRLSFQELRIAAFAAVDGHMCLLDFPAGRDVDEPAEHLVIHPPAVIKRPERSCLFFLGNIYRRKHDHGKAA